MKVIVCSLFSWLLVTSGLHSTAQQLSPEMKVIIGSKQMFIYEVSSRPFFARYNSHYGKLLKKDSIIGRTLYAFPGCVVVDKKDTVVLSVPIVDLYYERGMETRVFAQILETFYGLTHYDVTLGDYWFFKSGKIFCLDESRSKIRIISVNFCADQKKFGQLINALRESGNYDKVFAINCGADKRDIKIF